MINFFLFCGRIRTLKFEFLQLPPLTFTFDSFSSISFGLYLISSKQKCAHLKSITSFDHFIFLYLLLSFFHTLRHLLIHYFIPSFSLQIFTQAFVVSKRTKEQSWLRQSADEADLEMVRMDQNKREEMRRDEMRPEQNRRDEMR